MRFFVARGAEIRDFICLFPDRTRVERFVVAFSPRARFDFGHDRARVEPLAGQFKMLIGDRLQLRR